MNTAVSDAEGTLRRVLWDCVARGGLGLAAGFSAIGVEILRNYNYGIDEGPVVAFTFALFAVGLGVIPVIATAQRWTPALFTLLMICFAVTGYCGMQYYAGRLAAKLNAAESASVQYRDARQAIEAARAELAAARSEMARIGELTPAAELQRLYDDADARAKAEATDPKRGAKCGEACRKAEAARDDYLPRIAAAKAREAAQKRAVEAQTRIDVARTDAKTGDSEANLLASLAAARFGGEAGMIARYLDLGVSAALVLGMLLFAALVSPSLALVIKGLRGEMSDEPQQGGEATQPASARPTEVPTEPTPMEPATDAVEKAASRRRTPEQLVARFIGERLRIGVEGAETISGQMFNALDVWWSRNATGVPMPSHIAFSKTLKAAGVTSEKRGGKVRYVGVALVN